MPRTDRRRSNQQTMRLEEAATLCIWDEFEHDPQSPCICGVAQSAKIVPQPVPIGIVADRQDVTRAEVCREVKGGQQRSDVRMWHQPDCFDIENADAAVANPRLNLPL